MNTKILASAALAAALVLGAQTSASAVDYAGAINANSAVPGAILKYTATNGNTGLGAFVRGVARLQGNSARSEAVITPASILETTVSTDADGALAFTVKLPTSAPVGSTYTLDVSVGTFQDTETFTVAGAPSDVAANGSVLPSTGVDATPYVWFGGGLLLLGAGLISVLAFVRRSRVAA